MAFQRQAVRPRSPDVIHWGRHRRLEHRDRDDEDLLVYRVPYSGQPDGPRIAEALEGWLSARWDRPVQVTVTKLDRASGWVTVEVRISAF